LEAVLRKCIVFMEGVIKFAFGVLESCVGSVRSRPAGAQESIEDVTSG
jgi:hypothetical protein